MAQGEYGARAGLPRLLALLDRYRLPATFFVPAISAKPHPQSMQDIVLKHMRSRRGFGSQHTRRSQGLPVRKSIDAALESD
jgi:peptidoglycan/xylan/chitin deacetylase (PgdA/CDA1 family)